MQVVIDMPEAYYECLMNTSFVVNLDLWCKQSAKDKQQTNAIFALIDALHRGTPLPEHYGDLIDRNELHYHCDYNNGLGCDKICYCDGCVHNVIQERTVNAATIIIPATKEGAEDCT